MAHFSAVFSARTASMTFMRCGPMSSIIADMATISLFLSGTRQEQFNNNKLSVQLLNDNNFFEPGGRGEIFVSDFSLNWVDSRYSIR